MKRFFKWFTLEDDDLTAVRISWFADNFEPEEFDGTDRLLAVFLQYCSSLDIVAKKRYLQTFLQTEGKKEVVKNDVRLETLDKFNYKEPAALEEAYRVITASVISAYDIYVQEDLADRTFKVDMKAFMESRKSERIQQIMADAFPLLQSGVDTDELIGDIQAKLDAVTNTYNSENLEDLDFITSSEQQSRGKRKMRFIAKTGLPCWDGATGGLYTQQLVSVTGAPGSGKTRLACAYFAYQVAVVYGKDVLFDELELTKMEVENIFIAHHIVNIYKGAVKIPDSLMNKDLLSEEQKRYYESARIDLFESGKYGNIFIRDKGIIVENLRKDMRVFKKQHPNLMFWVIDYAGLAESKPISKYERMKEEYDIIGDLYKNVKKIVGIMDIGALILNQFNREGVNASLAGKRIQPGHVQGGQIIQRHSDFDVAMTMTEEEEIANRVAMSTVKKRSSSGFQNVPFMTDKSVSIFRQVSQDSVK